MVDEEFFELLLVCLANQKFIGEAPPCGDALAMGEEAYNATQEATQKCIDEAYVKGWKLLEEARKL